MEWLQRIARGGNTADIPPITSGDDVRVWFKIRESGKDRLAHFEGVVIRVRGAGSARTFTVRRQTHGVGVERVFPLDAPIIEKIEVLRRGKTRRARVYFLRNVVKSTRLKTADGSHHGKTASAASPTPRAGVEPPPAPSPSPEKSEDAVAADTPAGDENPKS